MGKIVWNRNIISASDVKGIDMVSIRYKYHHDDKMIVTIISL